MSSRLTGNWSGLKRFTQNFGQDLHSNATQLQERKAEEIKNAITDTILGQRESWVPLKKATIEKKGNSKILVDTGEMANSFTVTKEGDSCIIHPKGTHNGSGLSNSELATIHEFGTNEIPPRPFVRPVYNDFEEEVPKAFKILVSDEIGKY